MRVWRPGWPCPVGEILAVLRHGPADPTFRAGADGWWRGVRTPHGPATVHLEPRGADGEIRATAWGDGAAWVLDAVPALLGGADDVSGFDPGRHPRVAALVGRHPHWRLPRTGLLLESLLPAVLEQKVTRLEANAGYRNLVLRFGTRAPGPGARRGVWVQPDAATLAAVPSWEWLRLPVTPARSHTVVGAARVAGSLERLTTRTSEDADRALRSLPGIGVWTSAEVRVRVFGDADAVSFGDHHVAGDVGYALTGRRDVDDDALAELLEPFRPHRYRVQRLVELESGRAGRPRRGPRMPPRTHLPGGVGR